MATLEDVKTWRGMEAVDNDGDKIGKIEDIYLDRQSGEPEWVAIKGGLFGSKTSFAPIRDASASGDAVRLPFSKEQVKDAPKVEADGELSPQEEQELYAHYGAATTATGTSPRGPHRGPHRPRRPLRPRPRSRPGGTATRRRDARRRSATTRRAPRPTTR